MDNPNSGVEEKKSGKGVWYVVGIIILLLLAWFLLGKGDQMRMEEGMGDRTGEMSDTSSPQTLATLFGSGKNVSCQYSSEDPSMGKNSGTVFVANGKMRGDFVSTLPDGKSVESHMISDGTTNYMWSSAMPGQGMKMMMPAPGDAPANPNGGQNEAVDWNKNYDYDCDSWNADDSKFALPTDVKFMDTGEMMQGAMPAGV